MSAKSLLCENCFECSVSRCKHAHVSSLRNFMEMNRCTNRLRDMRKYLKGQGVFLEELKQDEVRTRPAPTKRSRLGCHLQNLPTFGGSKSAEDHEKNNSVRPLWQDLPDSLPIYEKLEVELEKILNRDDIRDEGRA